MPYQPSRINFSVLGDIGQSVGAGINKYRLEQALNGLPVGPNGEVDYGEAFNRLAPVNPALAVKMLQSQGQNGVYGTPVYTQNPDGSVGVSAIGKSGKLIPLDSGSRKVLEPQHFINRGTEVQAVGTRSGQPSATYPVDVAGKASQAKQGEVQGQAAASIPDVLVNANNAIGTIDLAIGHPGRETATGMSSTLDPRNYFAGTEGTSYREGVLKQVQGQAFLGSIQQMRGLGSLSDAEGRAASAAQTALSTAQTDADHLNALLRLKAIELRGVIRTYQKAGQQPPAEVIGAWKQAEDQAGLEMKIPFATGTETKSQPIGESSNSGWTDLGNGVRIRPKQ